MLDRIYKLATGQNRLFKSRSSHWPKLRAWYLSTKPFCEACRSTEKLEVHHIFSYHEHPELELDPSNLIALCESKRLGFSCHLVIGHHGNFKLANKFVVDDAKIWSERTKYL
jgi:5-methylcytosine-specific restriction endonuclease McrA